MLAARLDRRTHTFAVEETPIPHPSPGQVRIRVAAAGICLSDLHLIDGTLGAESPGQGKITLGHEVAGTIETLGDGVPPEWTVGQRVLLQAGGRCGRCPDCVRGLASCRQPRIRGVDYDGGMAEYTVAHHTALVAIPDDLPFEQAAIIPDAVSTPWAAITSTAQVQPAQAVGVWGVGGLGAHTVQLLRAIGAAPIIAVDPLDQARDRALDFGADFALHPAQPEFAERLRHATGGRGLDVAFDMAGVPAVREQALTCLAPHGSLVLVGLSHDPMSITDEFRFSSRFHRVLGHLGSGPQDVHQILSLVRHHRLDFTRSVSDTLPLTDAVEGVERLRQKGGNPIRLILTP